MAVSCTGKALRRIHQRETRADVSANHKRDYSKSANSTYFSMRSTFVILNAGSV